jgi:hypothetical protein
MDVHGERVYEDRVNAANWLASVSGEVVGN